MVDHSQTLFLNHTGLRLQTRLDWFGSGTNGFEAPTALLLSNKCRSSHIRRLQSCAAATCKLSAGAGWQQSGSRGSLSLWHSEGQDNSCEPPQTPADPRCFSLPLPPPLYLILSPSLPRQTQKKQSCAPLMSCFIWPVSLRVARFNKDTRFPS